ncbi:MAG: tRNA (adenosine(37)-N6)-threonylcarbamoyltransferase complex dimerization subunit type 1 TsaB [Lachnospiraceae bacterium]|jgi:tRNA threonylcarbamoyladenosine biosynthesis protein TsaB|nr:tRNA (adenosine(37)-N6)-threonylcarbamoyltransferase complex dimerization subunit type 1 TsaB [Lachnospiraceae bacterium]
MLILGIEAAAKVAGAALYEDGRILAEQMANGALTHSETLMPMIDAVFKAAGREPEELDYIALTSGPGSFTGLRIGAATAKGLALGLGIPVIPLSTLEVLAYGASGGMSCVPMMDARRGQVYSALYAGEQVLMEPQAISIQELAEKLRAWGQPCMCMGDAADLYREQLSALLGAQYHIAPPHLKDLRAAAAAALAAEKLAKGLVKGICGSELTIEYLRKPQAEREREARLSAEALSQAER